jgi:hypothetical protein
LACAQIWIFLEPLCLTPFVPPRTFFSLALNPAVRLLASFVCRFPAGLHRSAVGLLRASCSCLSRSTRFSGASVVVARFRHGVFVRRLQQGLSSGFFQAPVGPALPFDFVFCSRPVAPVIDFSSLVLCGGFSSCCSILREHEPTSPVCELMF